MRASRHSILIIDDEEDLVASLAFRFGAAGYDALIEPNGQLGFQTALDEQPSLILLDVMMPGLDGFEVLRMLRARQETRATPVIMLTTKSLMRDVMRRLSLALVALMMITTAVFADDADDYVTKPFDWDRLLNKVERLIATR